MSQIATPNTQTKQVSPFARVLQTLFSCVFLAVFAVTSTGQNPLVQDQVIHGTNTSDNLGQAVAIVGDTDGDGFDDYAIRGPWAGGSLGQSGSVIVYSGQTNSVIRTYNDPSASGGHFGENFDNAGDVNNDGYDDIIIGAYLDDTAGPLRGRCYVYSGLTGSNLYTIDGQSIEFLGQDVAGLGDINNDGFGDFVVGAPVSSLGGPNTGAVYVYSGIDGSILHAKGANTGQMIGLSVDNAGDCNGDGINDFMTGDPRSNGLVIVWSGIDGNVLNTINNPTTGGDFGEAVAGIGDVNGDGVDDIAISQPEASTGVFTQNGTVHIYSVVSGTLLHSFSGNSNFQNFGQSIDGAGDIDGDGKPDLAIGSPRTDDGFSNGGSVDVFSGMTGTLIKRITGPSNDALLGSSVGGGGDLNNDGDWDLIAGAPNNLSGLGSVYTYLGDRLAASEAFSTSNPIGHLLTLDWTPDGGDTFAGSGTITCSGASPGGIGVIAVSLSKVDMTLFGFTTVVVDIFTSDLFQTHNFGFDNSGLFTAPNVSRINPSISGMYAHIQVFELSTGIPSSNGLSLLATD